MAKVSMIEREKKRQKLVDKYAAKREALKEQMKDPELSLSDRVKISMKLAKLPRNSSPTRLHNRCEVSGRPRAYYRKLKMSRIALRDYGSVGQIPGLIKSSW
jgi:small subunit ribosomal protein S14